MKRTDVGVLTDSVKRNAKCKRKISFQLFQDLEWRAAALAPLPACSARLSRHRRWRCLLQLASTAEEDPLGVGYKAITQVINPLIFRCVRCQTRQNKREEDESRAPNYAARRSPPGFRGRPFLSPLGEFRCGRTGRFAASDAAPASPAEDSAGSERLRVARLNQPASIEMEIWLDIAFPWT